MKINKNLQFTLHTIILIVLILFLAYDFLLTVYNPKLNLRGIPVLERLNIYYAFWTTQTNYLVVIYLLVTFYLKSLYGTKRLLGLDLAVTTYITITFLVFWFGLVLSKSEASNYQVANWISTVTLHLIIPLIMIYSFIKSAGAEYLNWRCFGKGWLVITIAYPIIYLVFVMLRGEMRFQAYGGQMASEYSQLWFENKHLLGVINPHSFYDTQMFYPYWFLDYRDYTLIFKIIIDNDKTIAVVYDHPRAWWWSIITFIFIIGISTAFILVAFAYLKLNNNIYYLWHDIHGRWLSNEEHKYQVIQRRIYFKNKLAESRLQQKRERLERQKLKKIIFTLSKEERKIFLAKYHKEQQQKKVEVLWKNKVDKIIKNNEKEQLKRMLSKLPRKDVQFIKKNLRDAIRYQKLVKKRVLTIKKEFD